MSHKLVVIWLDSADASLVERWMNEGHLPHLDAIRREGLHVPLKSFEHSLAETVQQFVITGRSPAETGYWSQLHFDRSCYSINLRPSYDYSTYPPFYALGPDHKVCSLDFPQMGFHPGVHGLQMRGWGSHGPMCEFSSEPADWSGKVTREIGLHPCHKNDYAVLQEDETLDSLYQRTLDGVALRTKLCRLAWDQGPWDLFFPAFSEIHLAGHYLYEHPANHAYMAEERHSLQLRNVYVKTDEAVGEIRRWLDPDTHLALFTVEGMRQNSDELSSIAMLPELLFRHAFPGRKAMDFENLQPSPEDPDAPFNWVMEAWNLRRREPAWARYLRHWLPLDRAVSIERSLNADGFLLHPSRIQDMNYQPTLWYQPYWKHMKAFALPSFSDGFIRLNLRGREAHGIVEPSDYPDVCSSLETMLHALRHPETGRPIVKKIVRTRPDNPLEDSKLPPADLVVIWDNPEPCGHVASPYGEIGPYPGIRAGQHIPEGFFMATGPRIPSGSRVTSAHVLDIHPTLMDLMGITPEVPYTGDSLLKKL